MSEDGTSAKGIPIKRLGCYYAFGQWEIKSKVVHCEGGGVGDQKKLTKASLKSQGCYVTAIRKNIGNLDGINKTFGPLFNHKHKNGHRGKRCPSKAGSSDADKHVFPDFVCSAIQPVFWTLSQYSLLETYLHGGSHHTTESFHNLMWERCPKSA